MRSHNVDHVFGSLPDVPGVRAGASQIPFDDLTKLLNDQSKQLQNLCKQMRDDMKGEVMALRKEVLKENISVLNCKLKAESKFKS